MRLFVWACLVGAFITKAEVVPCETDEDCCTGDHPTLVGACLSTGVCLFYIPHECAVDRDCTKSPECAENACCEVECDVCGHCIETISGEETTCAPDADGDGFCDPRGNTIDVCDEECPEGFLPKDECEDDCCDEDEFTFPGSPWVSSCPNACGEFDYDCDGRDEEVPCCSDGESTSSSSSSSSSSSDDDDDSSSSSSDDDDDDDHSWWHHVVHGDTWRKRSIRDPCAKGHRIVRKREDCREAIDPRSPCGKCEDGAKSSCTHIPGWDCKEDCDSSSSWTSSSSSSSFLKCPRECSKHSQKCITEEDCIVDPGDCVEYVDDCTSKHWGHSCNEEILCCVSTRG